MVDIDDSEIYNLIHVTEDMYVFIHYVTSTSFKEDFSYEIYNVLIHDKIIVNPKFNIVIYEFINNIVNVIVIRHDTNEKFINDDNFLKQLFISVFENKTTVEISLIVEYTYHLCCFNTYKLSNKLIVPCNINNLIARELKLNNIIHVKTIKPFII